jgi:hypothetical protein
MNNRIVLSSCAAAMLSLGVAGAQTQSQTPTQSPVQGSTQGITGQQRPTTGTQSTSTWTGCVMRAADYTQAHAGTNAGSSEFVLSSAMMGAGTRSSAEASGRAGDASAGVSGSTTTGGGAVGTSGSGNADAGVSGGVTAGGNATDQAGSRPGATVGGESTTASGNAGSSSNAGNTSSAGSAGNSSSAGATANSNTGATGSDRATSRSSASTTAGSAYGLTASGTELAQHVGKRVEIVGSIEGGANAATGSVGTSGRTSGDAMQRINVTSVRVVPGNCQ